MKVQFIKDYEKPHRPGKFIKAGTVTEMTAKKVKEMAGFVEVLLTIDTPVKLEKKQKAKKTAKQNLKTQTNK